MSGQASADLRLGRWQDVLADVECDACIFDAPFGERTHAGHNAGKKSAHLCGFKNAIEYASIDEADVLEIVKHFSPRTAGWLLVMTSHDLIPAWEQCLSEAGRYVFAPLPYLDVGKGPRILGDGPASWTTHLVAARPRCRRFMSWGSLPGCYLRSKGDVVWKGPAGKRMGGKPLGVMRAIVRDYSRPGDLVCDPFAGHATTLLAALIEGRRAVGSEVDPEAHQAAAQRLARGYTPAALAIAPTAPRIQLGLPLAPGYERGGA